MPFAPSVFPVSLFPPSVFPPGLPEEEVIEVPGVSGAGGVYGGLVAPLPVTRRIPKRRLERECQDMRDLIDIITIMLRRNML